MANIYLDHNATTPLDPRVQEALSSLPQVPFNPSSIHYAGRYAKQLLEEARRQVKSSLSVPDDYHVVFSASGTEANNLAIKGFGGRNKLVSTTEHPSVLKPAGEALLEVDQDGIIRLEVLEHYLRSTPGPTLISVMLANNETGVIQPLRQIVDLAKRYGAFVHTDATQAVGRIPVSVSELGVDMLTCSSHKISGPHGVGALILHKSLPVTALMQGGGQEYRLRPGTQNVAAIHGFGLACSLLEERIQHHKQITRLRNQLENELTTMHPEAIIAGANALRLPNTSSIIMPSVLAETQVIHFDLYGIAVSAGSACSSGKIEVPYVHMAMGYSHKEAQCAIRVSMGLDNTEYDVQKFCQTWQALYIRQQKVSNF